MRGIEISLNQTQKIRLQRALKQLESLYLRANFNASVTVADTIPVSNEDTILKYALLSLSLLSLNFLFYVLLKYLTFLCLNEGVMAPLSATEKWWRRSVVWWSVLTN